MAKPKHDKKRHSQQASEKPAAQVRVDPAHVIADGRVAASEMVAAQLQTVGAAATSSATNYAASEAAAVSEPPPLRRAASSVSCVRSI